MIFKREPVAIQAAAIATLNLLAALDLLPLTAAQLAAANTAIAAILGLVTRSLVTPVDSPRGPDGGPLLPGSPPRAPGLGGP